MPPASPPAASAPSAIPHRRLASTASKPNTSVTIYGRATTIIDDKNKFMPQITTSSFLITGLSSLINFILSEKSCFIICHIPMPDSHFTNGILIKSSITADNIKHIIQTYNTGPKPYALYTIPPSTGPNKEAKELIVLIIELAVIKYSALTSAGTLACTEGWYTPAILNKTIIVTVIRKTRSTFPISTEKTIITAAVKKSSITIILRLFILSAIIPPIGDKSIAGINAHAVTMP